MHQVLFHIPATLILTSLIVVAVGFVGIFVFTLIRPPIQWIWLIGAAVVLGVRQWLAPRLDPQMPIYGYGVMMVLGFFGALQLARFLARRSGIDPEAFVNAGLIALLTGVIGARLSHVLESLPQYT